MVVEALSLADRIQSFARHEPRPITEARSSPEDWEVLGALQEFGKPKPISSKWAIYNTVSIPAPELSGTILLSRAVDISKIKEGEPDRNSLHVCITDPSGNHRQRLKDLELPVDDKIVNWEDARVGTNGKTLGFTVVLREGGKYNPHPALVNVEIKDDNLKVVGDPRIFESIIGKNVFPFKDGFIYRPDGVSHELHYLDRQGGLLEIIDFSNFRDTRWLSKKMGATARPIEREDGLKQLLIHGVRGGRGIDGSIKDDIYAIGLAILDKNWRPLIVDPEPLLERKDYLGNLHPSEDLRSEKEVVYLCDFTEGKDGLILPTTVGDKITVRTHIPYALLNARFDRLLRLSKVS